MSLKKLSLHSPLSKASNASPKKFKVISGLPGNKPFRQKNIEENNTVSKLTIQNDLLRNRLKVLSQQMDTIITQETMRRQSSGSTPQSRSHKYPARQDNYSTMLEAQIEKANTYSETLTRQRNQVKTRLDALEENPTY